MQTGESTETLGVEVYRAVPVNESLRHKIECMTTRDDLIFVGTNDSKIIAYRTQADCKTTTSSNTTNSTKSEGSSSSPSSPSAVSLYTLTLLQEVAEPRRHAVRALTVVGDRHLLALVGDTIVLYNFSNEAPRPFQLREITAIAGLKDVFSFHVKQQKGVLALAVLQRRCLTIYEATFDHLEFLLKETVALPDGVRVFGWMGRRLMLCGRNEYFLYDTALPSSKALYYPTPRSGAALSVLSMAPVPEVLVAGGNYGVRALLSDGSEVPGDSRVSWASPPVSLSYEYPFVVSQHATGLHTLQVRLPLLTTLEESAKTGSSSSSSSKNSLLQYIDIPTLAKMSQCWWTDYDCPMPTKTTEANALARHPIVVADASNRLFVLTRTPIAAQAETLATRKLFAAADLLCQLCPHEVQADTLRRIVVADATHRFLTLHDYAGCFHDLNKIDADARLAIQLFPGFMRTEDVASFSSSSSCPVLSTTPPASVMTTALPSLTDYLQSRRLAFLLRGAAFLETEAARAQLACVDRALVMSYCLLREEAPLLSLLQGENWCAVEDTAAVLTEHAEWVALVVLLEAHDRCEAAAEQLCHLVGALHLKREEEKEPWKALPEDVQQALHRFFAEHSRLPSGDDAYLPKSTVQTWWAGATAKSQVAPSDAVRITETLIGAATALTFFRRRVLPAEQQLFAKHLSWVLGCVPPENGLRIFFSAQNVQQYATALRLLEGYKEMSGGTSKQLLLVSYLHLLFNDNRVHLTEESLYEQYWKGLGDLLFTDVVSSGTASDTATGAALPDAARQRYRSRLDEFLLTSPNVNLDAAEQYFNAPAIKAACVPERALIYRRQGAHRSAVEMFVNEAADLESAKAYANSVRSEDDGDAFTALLELLLQPSPNTANAGPRVEEALSILNTCDGVNAALVLPMLPDDLPFAQLSGFLLHAFRDATTAYHMSAIDSSILAAKLMAAEETRAQELSRSAVLEDAMVCPVCQRRLRPDTVLAVYPSGLLVHQGCVRDEHVCPATHRDYRYDAYSLLEDL